MTDSFRGYQKLSYEMNVNYIRITRNKHKNSEFNIQLLNNYLVYHNIVDISQGSID